MIHRKKRNIVLFLLLVLVFLFSCERPDVVRIIKIETLPVTTYTSTTATLLGNIIDPGEGLQECGHIWWKTYSSVEAKITSTARTGIYSNTLTVLLPGTTYSFKAFASNAGGTTFGEILTFTTPPVVPTVTTAEVTNKTTTSAQSGGTISNDGGSMVTSRGVCWSINQHPTIENNKTTDGEGTGTFTSNLAGLSPNTTYYVRAYATNSVGPGYGNQVVFTTDNDNIILPSVTTAQVTEITLTSAQCGGEVTNEGGSPVTARGVCWSTFTKPTVSNYKTNDGSGMGVFTSSMTDLYSYNTYYVRAYATNAKGTQYGDEMVFITNTSGTFTDDRDGHVYNWVRIGSQVWMAENLAYLPSVSPPSSSSYSIPYYYVYDYYGVSVSEAKATTNYSMYSVLYNWTAAMNGDSSSLINPSGVRGACPDGWHLPSISELGDLVDYIGGYNVAGGMLKEKGYSHWMEPNYNASNSYGFNAIPGGGYWYQNEYNYYFALIGYQGYWWTTSKGGGYELWGISYDDSILRIYADYKNWGHSVRCVRDN